MNILFTGYFKNGLYCFMYRLNRQLYAAVTDYHSPYRQIRLRGK